MKSFIENCVLKLWWQILKIDHLKQLSETKKSQNSKHFKGGATMCIIHAKK